MATVPLYIQIDPTAQEPLQAQVYRGLRRAITDGRLAAGSFLPSTRALAGDLHVGRNTVLRAIQRLQTEGFVESQVGSGVRVKQLEPQTAVPTPAVPDDGPPPRPGRRGAAVLDLPTVAVPSKTRTSVPFRAGMTPLDVFPERVWARLVSRRWRTSARTMLESGDPLGYHPLREAVADYLRTSRGLTCDADHVIITSGAQHSLDIVVRSLLNVGDWVWIEDPGRPEVRRVLATSGARPVPVAVDREGFNPNLARRLGDARMAIVTPSCHMPTGVTLSLRRRMQLVEWARETNAWLVEDDHCAETRFVGRPLPALHRLDGGHRTIYIGSFANSVFPGVRLGYVVVPDSIREVLMAVRALSEQHAPTSVQATLTDFIDEGHFARHLRRLRDAAAERYDALTHALSTHCGSVLDPWPANAGMHIVTWLPAGVPERMVVREGAERGVELRPLSRFRYISGRPGLVLCFGGWPAASITGAVQRLAPVLEKVRTGLRDSPSFSNGDGADDGVEPRQRVANQ